MRNEAIYMGAGSYRCTLYRRRLSYHGLLHRSNTDYDDVYYNNICVFAPADTLWQGGAEMMIDKILDLFAACMMPGGNLAFGATIAGLIIIALFASLIDGGYYD